MTDDLRKASLETFGEATGIHDLVRITQRGRDPKTARFAFHLHDGTEIPIGTINILWSQTELAKVLAVAIGHVPEAVETKKWRPCIAALIHNATDVDDLADETYAATVRDWLTTYADTATTDTAGAPALRDPFIADGHIHIHASAFAKHIRREHGEQINLPELRQALADLGFHHTKVSYDKRANGGTRSRTSASYYSAPTTQLESPE